MLKNDKNTLIQDIPHTKTTVKPTVPVLTTVSNTTSSDDNFVMTGSYDRDILTRYASSFAFGAVKRSAASTQRSINGLDNMTAKTTATADTKQLASGPQGRREEASNG